MSKVIPLSWFIGVNMTRVERDLEKNPDLLSKLPENLREDFIEWAANERIIYEADLDEEIKDFLNKGQ